MWNGKTSKKSMSEWTKGIHKLNMSLEGRKKMFSVFLARKQGTKGETK